MPTYSISIAFTDESIAFVATGDDATNLSIVLSLTDDGKFSLYVIL